MLDNISKTCSVGWRVYICSSPPFHTGLGVKGDTSVHSIVLYETFKEQ